MRLNIEDIRRQYAELTDEALLEVDRDDLVEAARQCFDEEVARRQLKARAPDAPALPKEPLEIAATYETGGAANGARAALRSAGIDAYLTHEFPEEESHTLATAYRGHPIFVAVSQVDAARDVLEQHTPEEEPTPDQSHIRHGVGAVRPFVYGDLELPGFVQHVFGALELERQEFSPSEFHVEAMIGDSVIAMEASDPIDPEATTSSIYIYVPDVDDAYARALDSGAVRVSPPEDKPYHERVAGVKDTSGNTWWIATYTGE